MKPVIGVMGGGSVDSQTGAMAEALGAAIAKEGWVLLNGGRDSGVMAASARGAKAAGGFVVGILPTVDAQGASPDLDLAIRTGMGSGRNVINVLSSDVVVVLPGAGGTMSEAGLAAAHGKPLVFLGYDDGRLPATRVDSVEAAVEAIKTALA